jgi:hypothetical protein
MVMELIWMKGMGERGCGWWRWKWNLKLRWIVERGGEVGWGESIFVLLDVYAGDISIAHDKEMGD